MTMRRVLGASIEIAALVAGLLACEKAESTRDPAGAGVGGQSGASTGGTSASGASGGAAHSGGIGASGAVAGEGGASGAGTGGAGASGAGASGAETGGTGTGTGGVSTGGEAGAGGTDPVVSRSCDDPGWDAADFAAVYDVGPGHPYATPSDVPWESIGPGTLVRIHWREAPYADKWVIAVEATAEAPVVILGVPSGGALPQIVGRDAVTRPELSYWSDTRGVIKIGGSSAPDVATASHVFVECLDIAGARGAFTDDAGAPATYDDNASAIFLESGTDITLRNNRFHDCGNGLFVASESARILVSGNQLFDNGNVGSNFEHNSYTEAQGIVFELNRYGELCAGCTGNNLKDRSSGLVVRYNEIVGGNRALDLVDSTYASISGAADYHDSYVYGNVLVELDGGNRQIVHYGGDSNPAYYRTGTLHFYHNTVVSERSGLASVVRLSSAQAHLEARNNIFYALGGGAALAILEDAGTANLAGNWLPVGWREGSPSLTGTVTATNNQEGTEPGFMDAAARDYALTASSEARGVTVALAAAAEAHPVELEYTPTGGAPRSATTAAGAFE